MVGYTYTSIPLDFSSLSEMRNLKIRMVTEDIKFEVEDNLSNFYSNYLNFIIEQYPDAIISGSLALDLYGLLNRPISDIDLIVNKRPAGVLHKDTYGDENIMTTSDRLGYQYITESFKWRNIFNKRKTYQVDFFLNTGNVKYNTFAFKGRNVKIQDPVQITEQKIAMVNNAENHMFTGKQKHNLDLFVIFKHFNWGL
jgi:uncharacterized protein YjfI (DUF2170 family)